MSKSHDQQTHPPTAQLANTSPSSSSPPSPNRVQNSGAGTQPDRTVTPEQIRPRAYDLFQTRKANGGYGTPTDDWLEAERDLISKAKSSPIAQEVELKTGLHAGLQTS